MSKEGFRLALERARADRLTGKPAKQFVPTKPDRAAGTFEHFASLEERASHVAWVEQHKAETPF